MNIESDRTGCDQPLRARVSGRSEVLVVDDCPEARAELAQALEGGRVPLAHASTAAEALRAFSSSTSVVVLSALLPDATGFELCAALKARGTEGRPFVLIRTGPGGGAGIQSELSGCGADGVIRAGAAPEEVATAIRGFLRADLAEQRVRRLEEERHRRDELCEELLAVAGHDLRTPLQAILLSATSLRQAEPGAPAERHLERIERSTRRATSLVNQLLDLTQARLGRIPVRPEWTELSAVVRDAVEELRAAHPHRRIELDAVGTFTGRWDPERVAQVASNLVQNALTHGAPDLPVRVGLRMRAEGVALTVWNGGAPIDPDELPALFLAFRRGPRAETHGRGLGIGLYLVERIVRAHRGRVSVRSSPEEGTEFTVLLPHLRPPEA